MTIKLIKTDSEFLEVAATKVSRIDGSDWYYLPFWYRKVGEDLYEQVTWDKLPESLKHHIQSNRDTPPTP